MGRIGFCCRSRPYGDFELTMKTKKREAPASEKPPYVATEKPPYVATEREKRALAKQTDRIQTETAAPRLKVVDKQICPDHPNADVGWGLLAEALGTTNHNFVRGMIRQLAEASSDGSRQIDARKLNFLLSVIKDINPKDQLEAMLAAQMAVVHMATMMFSQHFALIENLPQQDAAERAFNKLARTFTTQLEALKRYRTGGEQKVTVQHVSVGEGGQAIVGNVTQAATETTPKRPAKVTPALTDARQMAMPIIDQPKRAMVPVRRKQRDDEPPSA
jgi:hypothetical protein